MPAAAAIIAVRFTSETCLNFGDRLNSYLGIAQQVIESAAQDRIAAAVYNGASFNVAGS